MSILVKLGKAGKKLLRRVLPAPVCHVSCVRRIERVKTARRICAMTFDDGPMNAPANPDRFGGRAMTDVLLDTLAEFGAHGTFDVIGDTADNYPDRAGKPGSPAWGGVKFDHYPDIHRDALGGAAHNDRLIRRMLAEGHQITNHGYRHILFGKKPFVYGKRVHLDGLSAVIDDLDRLDRLMRETYGYSMTMSRPPHYVDKIAGGFTSYDAYATMGYQYLAASFDGAGWLPSVHADPEEALRAEIRAMVEPMKKALAEDPDCFCGQIIFQKDGCNMARRTPVAFALREQLQLLKDHGYEVVTVDELMRESPFADLGRDDPLFEKLNALQKTRPVVYSDNRLRLDKPMTWSELALLLYAPVGAHTRAPAASAPVGARTRAPAASASVGAHTVRPQGESVSDQPQPTDSAPIHPTGPAPWGHDMRPDETVSPAASAPVEAHILPPESETPPILCGPTYRTGVKLRFFFNDLAAGADLLRHGKLGRAGSALLDAFRVREALNDREDRKAYRKYLRSYLPGRRGK